MLRRALLVAVLGALATLVAVSPARADGAFYIVTGVTDGAGSCAVSSIYPGAFECSTLRAAVTAANADAAQDDIFLQTGATYTLNQVIPLTTDVSIFSGNARTTTIQGTNTDRLFTVADGVSATIYGVTLTGGNAGAGEGGAIVSAGSLSLLETRVTGNRAANGGGISNAAAGDLQIAYSLIDQNQAPGVDSNGTGGGIINHGSLSIDDSTIALNTASRVGGITSDSTADTATVIHATVAGNVATGNTDPGGVSFAGPWTSDGSMFLSNDGDSLPSNCGSQIASGSGNIADDSSCGFGAGDDRLTTTPTIQLSDEGGMTDVVDITGTPADGFETTTCTSGLDQRIGQRPSTGCDAGAYENEVPAGAISPLFPFPTPPTIPTPPATPTATATPVPTPTPVAGKSAVVKRIKGTVRIKIKGTNKFIVLSGTQDIPNGSTLDTKHGTVQLTSLQKAGGKPQTAIFFDGIFRLSQTKATTDLTLSEALAPCGKKKGKAASAAAAAKKKAKPKTRKLWGNGHGSFRTNGQYSAATVRGTEWLVEDSCAGTLTRVRHGVVSVRDNVRHTTITLRAGKHYLARPKR